MNRFAPLDTINQNGFNGFPLELEQMRGTAAGRSIGVSALFERQGMKIPTAQQAADDPNWGINQTSSVFDGSDQYANPAAASEVIQQWDIQRCVSVASSAITPDGVLFELLHWQVPAASVAIVERLPTILKEVTSLDGAGVPIFTHGSLNGSRPCVDSVPHANALIAPLQWRYFFTWTDRGSLQPVTTTGTLNYAGPVSINQLAGNNVIPPWNDLRYGHDANQGSIEQFIFPPGCLIRYWVLVTGPTDRFDVQIGARLVGFNQSCGRKGAALDSVLRRHV